jgi:hypothetical protein
MKMKWLLIVLTIGSSLAGCAAQTRESEPVYYMTGDGTYVRTESQQARSRSADDERAAQLSRRDFAQPAFGFWR